MSESAPEELSSNNALVLISNEYTSTPISLAKNPTSSPSDVGDMDNTPRILCNELIVNPLNSKSLEKLDELSCLEREIAKMHHTDDGNLDLDESLLSSSVVQGKEQSDREQMATVSSSVKKTNGGSNGKIAGTVKLDSDVQLEGKLDAFTSGETALEHEDLIAVLKGLDSNNDEAHNTSGSAISLLEEGVTIEGEGEYQIMEVIDDDSNATEDPTKAEIPSSTSSPGTGQSLNKTKTFGSTSLTPQEERALALEQMEGLKTARRRKQDIKPIKQIDPALELISALEADWSENDEDSVESSKTEPKPKLSTTKAKMVTTSVSASKNDTPLITSVVVIPPVYTATIASTAAMPSTTISPTLPKENISSTSNVNNNPIEEIKASKSSPKESVVDTKTEEESHVLSSHTGFRRTRIIKRKIIWDPDAPETTFSYAKLVKSNNNPKPKTEQTLIPPVTKGSTTITHIKKEKPTNTVVNATGKKIPRPVTPKAKKLAIDSNVEKPNSSKSESNVSQKTTVETETKSSNTKLEEVQTKTTLVNEAKQTLSSSTTTSPPKRRSQTPVANGPAGNAGGVKKKKITEIDRLMGDEGAVNMLNSLEKLEATLTPGESKPTRPMMRSRASTICEKLPRKKTPSPVRTTPPAATNPHANKGKRTPKSRASSTWDYVYKKKKQDFDDSLIIRRRSNSSYSSTTSLNRLSIDGPPTSSNKHNTSSSSTKSDDSKSLPASSSETDLSKTPPTTSAHNRSSGSCKSAPTSTPPTSVSKSFEFAKPENKKSQKRTKSPAATLTNDMKKAAPVVSKRNVRSPSTINEDKGKEIVKTPPSKSPTNVKDKKDTATTLASGTVSDVVVKKSYKVAQIIFNTHKSKLSNTFTIQMLNKLVDILDKLALDPDCHVVVMGTNDAHFCQGIDLTDLTTIAAEKRKNFAINLSTAVKNYLKTLATYPKPLVAGVSGNLMNLGVIQLAFFDVVIASDKTTFETPYAKMGQIPEGYCIWHNMNKIRGSFKTKLFWLCERIQSTEAALAGLVNKLTAANKVNDDAFAAAKRIASLSVESYRAMRKTVINSHLDIIVNSLDEEFETIIKQWTSNECLDNLKKYLGQN